MSRALLLSLLLAPVLASAYPKAPCDEDEEERGTTEERPVGFSGDGARVVMSADFVPENWVCASGWRETTVRDVETRKVLWSSRRYGADSEEERASLEKLVPPPIVGKYGLVALRRADVKVLGAGPGDARDLVASGVRAGGASFEVLLPLAPDALDGAWIAGDLLALGFNVYAGTERGDLTTVAIVLVPIRSQSTPAAYEALRGRVRAAADPRAALELIAAEAYRAAGNPFAAAALVYDLLPRIPPEKAPEAHLAALADLTLYLSKLKEPMVESCVYHVEDALQHPQLKPFAIGKVRRALEHNRGLCERHAHAPPAGPPR